MQPMVIYCWMGHPNSNFVPDLCHCSAIRNPTGAEQGIVRSHTYQRPAFPKLNIAFNKLPLLAHIDRSPWVSLDNTTLTWSFPEIYAECNHFENILFFSLPCRMILWWPCTQAHRCWLTWKSKDKSIHGIYVNCLCERVCNRYVCWDRDELSSVSFSPSMPSFSLSC